MTDVTKITNFFRFRRILIPVLIGLGITAFLIVREIDFSTFEKINWAPVSFFWLFLAILMLVLRDLGYILRIRLLTNNFLSWRKCFDVIMLWEFASAISPSIVGGSAIAVLIINKEKIPLGRSTAIVMATVMLDELFYIITVPLILGIVMFSGYNVFSEHDFILFGSKVHSFYVFLFGYTFMLTLTLIIIYAIFINPRAVKYFIVSVFKIRWLRKWRYNAMLTGNDLVITSAEMKGKSFYFWLKVFFVTVLSWTARFWIVNFLILAFMPVDSHLHIYAKQLIMWVIMLVSPTPGASGIAEFIFIDFLGVFIIAGFAPVLAVMWRLLSFYIYLIVGSIILPTWIKRVFAKEKKF